MSNRIPRRALFALLGGALSALLARQVAWAQPPVVYDSAWLQQQFDAAQDGDTITIPPGVYVGRFILKPGVGCIATGPCELRERSEP